MSVTYVRAIVECDACHRAFPVVVGNLLAVRKKLRAWGWDCTTRSDFCPTCNKYPRPQRG